MAAYTIINTSGETIERGLSLTDAADAILTSDGRDSGLWGRLGMNITDAYIEAMFWTSTGPDNAEEGLGPDTHVNELAHETRVQIEKDCADFVQRIQDLPQIEDYTPDQIGHDFWLTRNGHGSGFWDGDYSEPLGQELTDIAHSFGEVYLYRGDDNLLYLG
jgi:hypothetical protein